METTKIIEVLTNPLYENKEFYIIGATILLVIHIIYFIGKII